MTSLELSYLALTLIMIAVILAGYYSAQKRAQLSPAEVRKNVGWVSIAIALWIFYTFLVSDSGILKDFSLPPRFPILLILPLFLFTGILLYRKRNSKILHAIPRSWPIIFQTFRIVVESLFVGTVAIGYLHKEVTIEGYNFDMVFAFTAPLMAMLVYRAKVLPERSLIVWNYLGLTVIASIILLFTTTVFFPSVWGYDGQFVPTEFLDFPYILVAGFLMPMAVFVHILSIIQLSSK